MTVTHEDVLAIIAKDRAKERRERIATSVLAGFVADGVWQEKPIDAAKEAIEWADALIAELDKA